VTGSAWGAVSLLLLHLGAAGALPKEVPTWQVRRYALGEQPIRVLLLQDTAALALRPSFATAVEDGETGERLAVVSGGALAKVQPLPEGVSCEAGRARLNRAVLRFLPTGGVTALSTAGGSTRRYSGVIEVRRSARGLTVIEETDLESYVAGVVAAEVPASFPLAAVAAQAIAARTYALFHLGDHFADGADLCAQVHCQAYHGTPSADSRAARATHLTAGQVLVWNGVLVDAQYHAACGGSTVAAWETRQGKLLPYLTGASDRENSGKAFCAEGHIVTWSKRLTFAEAQRLVSRNLGTVIGEPGLSPGRLLDLRVQERSGNRVKWLEVKTDSGAYQVRGDAVRWLFGSGLAGPSGLHSTRFDLTVARDRHGRPTAFVFRGAGHGHGLGLCQWGARGRALAGESAADILAAYYPGAVVEDLRGEAPPAA
jgi:stage II sporulation protein D